MIEKEEEIKKLTSEVSVLAAANTKGTNTTQFSNIIIH
jgi:hypothetical protein